MILKIKAFIYRFSAIFGLRIYLAEKEEQRFVDSLSPNEKRLEGCLRGLWQAQHGFTTLWTYKQSFFKALIAKIKHAFDFRSYK